MYVEAAIALGSNVGDRLGAIHRAFDALAALPSTALVARSDVIETRPVGPVAQSDFLNAAALLRTGLAARALLEALLRLEQEQGRDRSGAPRWGPRRLDLDLLLYGDAIIAEPGLTVPHPHMHERRFVLEPLSQIAASMVHPVLGRTVEDMVGDLEAAEGA